MQAILSAAAERTTVTTHPDILDPTGRAVITQTRTVKPEGYPFGELRKLRAEIAAELAAPVLSVSGLWGARRSKVERIYGAITLDMSAAAGEMWPEGERFLVAADRYTRIYLAQLANPSDAPIAYQNDKGEFIFPKLGILTSRSDNGAYIYQKEGRLYKGPRIAMLRQPYTLEEWEAEIADVIPGMGLNAVPGALCKRDSEVFSANTFLGWRSELAPEAKDALFDDTRYADLRSALDGLAITVSDLRAIGRLSDHSWVARKVKEVSLTQALADCLDKGNFRMAGALVIWALSGPMAAKLMMSPEFVRWLERSVAESNDWTAHIAHLSTVVAAEPDPEIKDEIHQYIMALRDGPVPQPHQQ